MMILSLFSLVSLIYAPNVGQTTKPHIVFIIADDLGWNDVSWNNPTMITPNLEALARNGVIMNQSYVQPICTPSRSSLMTGYYPYRIGRQNSNLLPMQPTGVTLKYPFLPQVLRNLGYSTHAVGKWHMGFCDWRYTPTYRGFDTFFGYYTGSEDYYKHSRPDTDGERSPPGTSRPSYLDLHNNTKPEPRYNGTYSTHAFTKATIDLISKLNRKTPTFLYLPFQAVHYPLEVPQKYANLYKWIKNKDRRNYCGMMTALDEAVGRIVQALKRYGFWDNTLLVFTTDNGGQVKYGGNNWPLRGNKNTLWEGGTRGVAFVHGKGLQKTGYVNERLFHVVDWFPTLIRLAGGIPEKGVDGVDQWQSISLDKSNVRNKFVYNIYDKKQPRGAVRVGDYKLIVGDGGEPSGWYPPPQSKKRNYNKNRNLTDFYNNTRLHGNKSESQWKYQSSQPALKLFDVRADPRELNDLSAKYPRIVSTLLEEFRERSLEMVPADQPPVDPKGSPKYYGGVFTPGWCNATI